MPEEYRGVWISFLEFEQMDFKNKEAFENQFAQMAYNCKNIGLNTLIVHVRPFSDALYQSRLFPQSHLITGTQAGYANFDPLEVMLKRAKAEGLKFEAWVNPYRVKPPARDFALSAENPAAKWLSQTGNTNVIQWENGIYYNPASAQVNQLITDGVLELAQNYDIDAIQFDDYFYPATSPEFDKSSRQGNTDEKELAEWRRKNINKMVHGVYTALQQKVPHVKFGISPTANMDYNYNEQYCDVSHWFKTEGYAHYIMPQVYWGFHHAAGDDVAHFDKSLENWATLPRNGKKAFYAGLGAYRIGEGDGQNDTQAEWSSGESLAQQVMETRKEKYACGGFALFRYNSLFNPTPEYSALAKKETEALKKVLV